MPTESRTFKELRARFGSFIYRDFHIDRTKTGLRFRYDFEIPALAEFHPAWDFPLPGDREIELSSPVLRALAFSLGMAETISYWKCACPRRLTVACGALSEEQKLWWRKLFYHGLGEFMYRNGIVCSEEELVSVEAPLPENGRRQPLHDPAAYEGYLVPVGGGKDSVVSLELLSGEDITTYCIDGTAGTASIRAVTALCRSSGSYEARRTLDRRLIALNGEGFLNGHTPFSAVVAFSAVTAAFLTGRRYIALSNETSANETTVRDSFVNHQYSKSYEFEQDFTRYFAGLTDSDIRYFSLLRPLAEIQIAALFAGFTDYHMAFRSCNAGSKQGIWCGSCAKCLFVYIILTPFLSEAELIRIFGEKLLDKASLEKEFRELAGIDENKPFECVGTRSEVAAALRCFVERGGRSFLTDRYREKLLSAEPPLDELLGEWAEANSVPGELRQRLEDALGEACARYTRRDGKTDTE